ncbi:LysR family transcriptional regulator ArgP [Pseudomonas parakoreensis]
MFDYKLLSALAAVVEQAGFERAAQVLGLSQSAISQRIKLLEARVGQPVLVRGTPPSPTEIGRRLLNHVQQVRLLERDLQTLVPALDEEGLPERLRIALNADSLATWWAEAVGDFCAEQHLLLDLVVEDQTVGLKRMRAGKWRHVSVPANARWPVRAACCWGDALSGAGQSGIHRAAFPDGVRAEQLPRTPALVFGPDDFLQHRYLASLGVDGGFEHHLCPSSEGFVRLTEAGFGWGLVPELQVREQLQRGVLRELLPDKPIDVPLYWHHWRNGGQLLALLTEQLLRSSSRWLVPLG